MPCVSPASRRACLAALSVLFLWRAGRAAEGSWRDRLDRAEALADEGRIPEAAEVGRGALADADKSLGPGSPELGPALARLSAIEEAAGDEKALAELERRLEAVEPKPFAVWFALGCLYRRDGKLAGAERALKEALALRPAAGGPVLELARLDEDAGRFEDEIAVLRRAAEQKPRGTLFYMILARAYTHLGRFEEARAAFARGKELAGADAGLYIAEGYFYLDADRPAQAGVSFQEAVRVDTASPFGYHHLGYYYFTQGRYAEAEETLRKALRIERSDPATNERDVLHTLKWLGDDLRAQGRFAEAEAVHLEVVRKAPPGDIFQLTGLRSLAQDDLSQGKVAEAEKAYRRAADACAPPVVCEFTEAGRALLALANFYLDQGRRDEAAAAAGRAGRFCAGTPTPDRLAVLRGLAALYARLGDAADEEKLYARLRPQLRATPLSPDLAWVETGLGGLRARAGLLPEAQEHYRKAIEMLQRGGDRKREADVVDSLAAVETQAGQLAQARKDAERAKGLRASK